MGAVPTAVNFLVANMNLPLLNILTVYCSNIGLHRLTKHVRPTCDVFFYATLCLAVKPFFTTPHATAITCRVTITRCLPPRVQDVKLCIFTTIFFVVA